MRKAIVLAEPTSGAAVARVIAEGYAPDLNDVEIESLGRDPFLVAAALGGHERIVVSREVSAPSKRRHNRRVPDVCSAVGILCINDFELWRRLDFRIG